VANLDWPCLRGNKQPTGELDKGSEYGAFLFLVIAMQEMTDFFQKEAQECKGLAAGAIKKKDRDFWLGLAQRWDGLLKPTSTPDEADRSLRFDRPIRQRRKFAFAKRRAA